ncbi:MAG: ribonuclease III domain-containing protein [Clostridia bacterium]
MRNYLTPKLEKQELHNMSTLALAHIGDSVFEIMARSYLATNGVATSKNLHKATILMVNANAQAKFARHIVDELSESEQALFKRGRNSSPKTIPKNSTREDYGLATALEALFGYLYLRQEYDRINILFGKIIENYEKGE